ncbi:MAG: hypothetical protein LUF01_01835 [Bacteroides sp.]|nr:hypothetical protein [Bacteroides sp.]
MAKPIQDTPQIKGKDAKIFRKELRKSLENSSTPENKAKLKKEVEEMEKSYNLLVSISDGVFY